MFRQPPDVVAWVRFGGPKRAQNRPQIDSKRPRPYPPPDLGAPNGPKTVPKSDADADEAQPGPGSSRTNSGSIWRSRSRDQPFRSSLPEAESSSKPAPPSPAVPGFYNFHRSGNGRALKGQKHGVIWTKKCSRYPDGSRRRSAGQGIGVLDDCPTFGNRGIT
jgi:hypothetical protein